MVAPTVLPGLLLTSFLPGYLLVRALFPEDRIREPVTLAKTLVLACGFSIAVTVVVGSLLGLAPHGTRGWFTPFALTAALVLACVGLFWWGLRRQAYPRLTRRFARARAPAAVAAPAER